MSSFFRSSSLRFFSSSFFFFSSSFFFCFSMSFGCSTHFARPVSLGFGSSSESLLLLLSLEKSLSDDMASES